MAGVTKRKEHKWTKEELTEGVVLVTEHGKSLREAAAVTGIPKSTLGDYVTGRREIGATKGPPTILTTAEETQLANWAKDMASIGYGCTKEQILQAVHKIVVADNRPNTFTDNRPGKKWWTGFLKRHPELSLRTPENLDSHRAKCCTRDTLSKWYSDFRQFLEVNSIRNDAQHFWNADESGFSLCPKTGKVLAQKGASDVYSLTCSGKDQITTLCAGSASGALIPPMHIFAGQRFAYNPLEGGVPGAYFGKSKNGWIDSELFYGWLANHFATHVKVRPVILLIDGHRSHINLETSRYCHENGIFLYCLPPHSSHITQPLDVGFFKPLKDAWKKECAAYRHAHPGEFISKQNFASVFKDAWFQAARPILLVNAFRGAGIFPLDFTVIRESRFTPSSVFQPATDELQHSEKSKIATSTPTGNQALVQLESVLDEDLLKKYAIRYDEGYDLAVDPVYTVWKKLQDLHKAGTTDDPDILTHNQAKDKSNEPVPTPSVSIEIMHSRKS